MPSFYYHPFYAWSLVEELGRSGILPSEGLRGYAESRLHRGRQEGWLNEENRRSACWMFVFAKHVILPGEVDVPVNHIPALKGHIDWGEGLLGFEDRHGIDPALDKTFDLPWAGRIAAVANRSGASVEMVESVLDWWRRLREFDAYAATRIRPSESWEMVKYTGFRDAFVTGNHEEHPLWKVLPEKSKPALVKLLESDPLREKGKFAPWDSDISSSASFARIAQRLSVLGCPSLTRTNATYQYQEPSDPAAYEALVRFYFSNVRVPAPENAAEALRYRDNVRVVEWREKIDAWSANLSSGKADLKSVRQELDDASGYIEGATALRTAVSRISPWMTFGLAVLLEVVLPEFPGKHEATLGLLSIEGLRRVTAAIESSVTGSHPLQYGWLLIEPPKPSEE